MNFSRGVSLCFGYGFRSLGTAHSTHQLSRQYTLHTFQYIFFLRKSRLAATKKQMISVPVPYQSVLSTINQIPRLPKEAGLIPVTLKRKKEYKSNHKKELIDPAKIFKVLDILKRGIS